MQEQIITPRHKGHLLTAFERGQIEALHRQVLSNRLIAQRIGVCPQTINNELKRGLVRQVAKVNGKKVYRHEYSAEAAPRSYEVARQCCHRHLKCLTVTAFLARRWLPLLRCTTTSMTSDLRFATLICLRRLVDGPNTIRLLVTSGQLVEGLKSGQRLWNDASSMVTGRWIRSWANVRGKKA